MKHSKKASRKLSNFFAKADLDTYEQQMERVKRITSFWEEREKQEGGVSIKTNTGLFTRVPVAVKKGFPRVPRGGYLHRTKEAVIKKFESLKDKLSSVWKKKPSDSMFVRKEGHSKKGIPTGEIMMSPEKRGKTKGHPISIKPDAFLEKHNIGASIQAKVRRGEKAWLAGKRALVVTSSRGHCIGFEIPKGPLVDLAFGPTIRAAATKGRGRNKLAVDIKRQDWRSKIRAYKAPLSIIIVIDASDSMIWFLETIANAVLLLHRTAYRKRDRVGLIMVRGEHAKVLHHPTTNIQIVSKSIKNLKCGGLTPLASGLMKAQEVLEHELRRNPSIVPLIIVLSDGLANVPLDRPISSALRNLMHSPSQADVIAVARRVARKRIPITSINPLHLDKWKFKKFLSPTQLLKEISRVTGGKYYGFRTGIIRKGKFNVETVARIMEDSTSSAIFRKGRLEMMKL